MVIKLAEVKGLKEAFDSIASEATSLRLTISSKRESSVVLAEIDSGLESIKDLAWAGSATCKDVQSVEERAAKRKGDS